MTMIEPYRFDMLGFFEGLASMPDDLLGSAEWDSENGEMQVEASGLSNGEFALRAELWWPETYTTTERSERGAFIVAAPELVRFATSLAPFLRIPPGQGRLNLQPVADDS